MFKWNTKGFKSCFRDMEHEMGLCFCGVMVKRSNEQIWIAQKDRKSKLANEIFIEIQSDVIYKH